jgi:hypothetical protein
MSTSCDPDGQSDHDESTTQLSLGLAEFYSSQTSLLLSQYKNITQLLGQTDDWTWPGTHCEILLRTFLRRNLPSFYGVDKGYIYGRRDVADGTEHCPEIDILIHDKQHLRPILQLDDFVIVQAKAAKGIIQVKRTMDTDKLKKGLENIRDAKAHWSAHMHLPSQCVFSAIVFFDERPRSSPEPSVNYKP